MFHGFGHGIRKNGAIKPSRTVDEASPRSSSGSPRSRRVPTFDDSSEQLGKGTLEKNRVRQQTRMPLFSVGEWLRRQAGNLLAGMIHSHGLDVNRMTLVHTSPVRTIHEPSTLCCPKPHTRISYLIPEIYNALGR